ncbi:NAC domain-containing protein 86-like [Gossypium australe]|uniref:NAC domain-containing protein 86-like n=1 Tax=Gossypium australe TaxID=47621 RepID=A0A5B6WUM1_9ROSI|nr:NAC domain-containing protein 86-like [Gossypium australe]
MLISPIKAKQSIRLCLPIHAMNNPKPKGYGFNPSDQILISYLQDRTLLGRDYLVQDIIDLGHDICNYDPWDLPSCDSITPNDSERYFTYPKTYKYANSKSKVIGTPIGQVPKGEQLKPMINRATKNGKWKVSGDRVEVKSNDDTKQVIGIKTRLYFRHNSCPNKTLCILYQYELVGIDPCQDKYFLGKVIMKNPSNISSNNIDDRISIPQVRVELDPEPSVQTEVTNEYEWTQSEQTNEFITPYPIFVNENFIDEGNEVISYHQSQVRVELGSESLVETEVTNEYGWTQSEQTNETITPCRVFHNENFIGYGNEVISNRQSQINMELIRSLELPNIGIEDQNQSDRNIGIDNDRTVPYGSNQHNIVAVAENESSNNIIDFINQMEWSDLFNLFGGSDYGLFLNELPDEPQELGPQNQCGINQQVTAGAEIECTNLPPLDVAESSYSTDSVRKRSALEVEGSGTGVETELAQQQAKRSRS